MELIDYKFTKEFENLDPVVKILVLQGLQKCNSMLKQPESNFMTLYHKLTRLQSTNFRIVDFVIKELDNIKNFANEYINDSKDKKSSELLVNYILQTLHVINFLNEVSPSDLSFNELLSIHVE